MNQLLTRRMVSLPLVPAMVVSWMVTAAVPLTEPLVARIVAEPTPDDGAVYRPVEELMEPTLPLSTDQVTVADMGLPNWSMADAEKRLRLAVGDSRRCRRDADGCENLARRRYASRSRCW